MIIRKNLALILIVVLALFIRIYKINEFPPALNWDEVSHGYNAYSILITGKDEWGVKLPVIFRAYGDYKLPVYIYTLVPLIKAMGLNEFSVRLPGVIAGTGLVILTYFLTLELMRSEKENNSTIVALLASFLVATEPWSFFLSRGAFEANLSQFMIVLGILFLLKSYSRSPNYLILSSLFLGLSVWTYNSARIFVPLILVAVLIIFQKRFLQFFKKHKIHTVLSFFITALFFIPMICQLSVSVGQARYQKVAIIDSGAIGKIIEYRNNSNFPESLNRLIYNRVTYFGFQFSKNWLSHFSPKFLFFEGGDNYQFSVPGLGLMYRVNLLFIILGLLYAINKALKKDYKYLFLIIWLMLAPVPSSLTREAPQVLRSITFLPIPMVLSGLGVWVFSQIAEEKSRRYLYISYVVLIIIFTVKYLSTYFIDYYKNYSQVWQYGYKQAVSYIRDNYDRYDRIIISKKYGEPHEFLLFYLKWIPEKYQNDPKLIRFGQSDWYWTDRFDKFLFVNDWEVPFEEWQPFVLESKGESVNCANIKCLLVTSPGNVPKTWNKLETINFTNGTKAFEIYEN